MRKNEKELFKSLCSFKAKEFDTSLADAATPTVLGHLFYNRMQSTAYGMIKANGLLGRVNREFRNSLSSAYERNVEKNKCFFWCVNHVGEALSKCNSRYAMLKGAYLCKAYPEGYRTSNDIDLLVHPNDVTEISNALRLAGFRQGNVRNGFFLPATRREIIESKMTRGETVPYVKEVNLPEIKFLEVDINFSLDYKPSDNSLTEEMLKNSVVRRIGNLRIQTLRDDDFFVHLCSHLYKEASTLPWVEMMRDMTLYKYADIYMLLNNISMSETDTLFDRARTTGTEKTCAFAVLQMSELFNFENNYAVSVSKKTLADDNDFIHTVISPSDGKTYVYKEKNIAKRFFSDNRKSLLEEVKQNEGS